MINMTWKEVLKNLEMDNTSGCCEDARLKIVQWFDEHADKLSKDDELRDALLTTSSALSEEDCEDLYDSIIDFMGMYDLKASTLLDGEALEKIMQDWDKCNEEPTPVENTQYDSLKVFADNQTAWMDKYIGGAKQ